MAHGIRCESAKSQPSECECECNGAFHGIQKVVEDFFDSVEVDMDEFEDMAVFDELPENPDLESDDELPAVGDVV